ncbi:multifunctional acyl-CoA thioesterase I/protease I/lysophospholipase L1 [Vibrio sp. SS-MA-C1-2]|uniref:multifunctional acyl-CoA thioesterase I/protease I/lysophospholipase L1 n=1 Tax=Vibrio sp. SS-MA-C1-2 TaxID=2908646 RepID=UPI001F466CB1|nr:multifunctional acyl-CoA thioesterase I/protease I/lysophospholipase L1 [Vibrio sp. SS-MA-C1-2]UJF18793.1 multifunctional acyl-CoA thioesterase I/protease I/lysophospholipase L1 [Vibrio sp. SS-MA-C1-2]
MYKFLFLLLFILSPISHANTDRDIGEKTLLILGDSLSAGYQMSIEQSWPYLLQEKWQSNQDIKIINASISGDTTGNGLARLPELLTQHQPNYLLIELGANDGLRGFPTKTIAENLQQIVSLAQQQQTSVMLMQIRVPPNYGRRYSEMFNKIFINISNNNNIPLLPFFLEKVIIKPELMMSDNLHPKPEAQPWIADYMSKQMMPYIN